MHGAEKCIIKINKGVYKFFVSILVIIIFNSTHFCISFAAYESHESHENNTKMVVGYPLFKSVNEMGPNDYYRGYNYEYLQDIARYTDWEYEFVVDTWDNCIQGLRDGTIDVMGYISKNDEREQFLEYANMPAGIASALLIASENNKDLSYKDLETINGCRVGLIRGSNLELTLDKLCKENSIVIKKFYYDTDRNLENALSKGSVDLALSTNFEANDGTQIILDFSADPFYFAVSKASSNYEEKIDKLNYAINEIFLLEPDYNQNLFSTYISRNKKEKLNFTEGERQFIKNSEPIKVVYDPNWAPLVYYDKKTKSMSGALAYLFGEIEEDTGLKFEYIKTDNYIEALEEIQTGKAWIITNFLKDYSWAQNNNIKITAPYMTLPIEMVINDQTDSSTVVVPKSYYSYYEYSGLENLSNIIYLDTVDACYKALASGKAKATYTNLYNSSYMMGNRDYVDLKTSPTVEERMEICLGLYKNAPKELISIMNKVSMSVTSEDVNQFAMKANIDLEEHSLGKWMYKNPSTAFSIAIAFFCVLILIMYIFIKERRNREKAMHYNLVTGIWNFGKFCIEADKILKKSDVLDKYVILHVNISRFRFINDIYGFEVGNQVLNTVAKMFGSFFEDGELYASLWADHFVCLLKCEDEAELRTRAEGYMKALNHKVVENFGLRLVVRAGGYFVTTQDIKIYKGANNILQYANHALSTIEDSYENNLACFNEGLNRQIEALRFIEKDMLKAFSNKEFVPYYQPKFNIYTNEIIGAEALVRWIHPIKGIIPPSEFIPHFEKNGFIIKVDLYIFEETCKLINKWLNEGEFPVKISCNFSRLHFENGTFVKTVKEIAEKYKVTLNLLELELTETIVVEEMEGLTKQLTALHDLGFSVSIDDFGSGYSSLSVLQQLNVDTIKLDKTFLENGVPTEREYKVMQAIVNLAEQLEMEVICEGVETVEHIELLKKVHCDCAQGFYYARPMPAKEINKLLLVKS